MMYVHYSFILICFVVLFPAGQSQRNIQIDFYQLVLQWPATYCSSRTCVTPPDKIFTLHGLWPDNSTRLKTPVQCYYRQNTPYVTPDQTQQNSLNVIWPNVMDQTNNNRFWRYEYNEHGRCAPGLTQAQYFSLAIGLFDSIDINNWVFIECPRFGILQNTYTSDFENCLVNKLAVTPILRFDYTTGNQARLKEVVICYDNLMNLMDCPNIRIPNYPPLKFYLPG